MPHICRKEKMLNSYENCEPGLKPKVFSSINSNSNVFRKYSGNVSLFHKTVEDIVKKYGQSKL